MWLPRSILTVCGIVAAIIALVVSLVTVVVVGNQVNGQMRNSAIIACDGANLLRGYTLIVTEGSERRLPFTLANRLLRVRDCEATFDEERTVQVSDGEQRAFLAELSKGARVAVRDGGRKLVPIP